MLAELIIIAAAYGEPGYYFPTRPNYEITPAGHVVVLKTLGGNLRTFSNLFDEWQAEGRTLIIADYCSSACTAVLSNPKACAMPKAYFGFHQAREYSLNTGLGGPSEEGTALLWARYPAKVKATIKELTPEFKWVRGTDLLPACP